MIEIGVAGIATFVEPSTAASTAAKLACFLIGAALGTSARGNSFFSGLGGGDRSHGSACRTLGLFVVVIVMKVVVGVTVLLTVRSSGVHMCWNRDMIKHSLHNRIP